MSGAVAANSGSHLIGRLEPRPPVIGQESSYAYTDTHTALSLRNYQQQRTEQRDMSVASCVSAMKPDNVKMKIGAPSLSHSPPSLLAPPPRQPPPLSLPPTNTQQTHTSTRDAGSNNKISSQSQDTNTASVPTSSSSCLRWAGGLHSLLDDKDGVEHFQTFLNDEGCAAMLKFWFACQGLKQHPSTSTTSTSTSGTSQLQHRRRLIVAMYRRFVKTTPSSLKPSTCSSSRDQSLGRNHLSLPLSEAVRERLTSQIEGGRVGDLAADVTIFDAAQQEVESIMERTLYPNFLQSDYYIQLVRQTEEHSNVGTACVDPAEAALGGTASATGDTSLSSGASSRGEQESGTHHSSTLTRTTLLQTQHNRNKLPSPKNANAKNGSVGGREIIDGASGCVGRSLSIVSKGGATVANPYHTLYSSYNPVSRQESELQSMSSGATGTTLTDDNASSVDGRCARVVGCGRSHPPTTSADHQRNTRHHLASNHRNHNHNHHRNHHNRKSSHQYRAIMREHAHVNHESSAAIYRGMIIQRSAKNVNSMQVNPSVDFDGFARILTVRLQQVLLDREMSDRASISDCMSGNRQYNHNHHNHNHNHGHNHSHNQWSDEANALVMEQTRYTEQNDQEILDAHISMVFESSRPTPQQHLSGHHSPSISTSGGGGGCVAAANSMPLWMSLPRSSTSSWQHHQQTPQLNASASRSSNMAKSRTFPDPVPTLARQVLPTSSGSQSRRQTAGVSSATVPTASSGVGPSASSMTASNLRSQDIPSEKVLDWMRSSEQQQHTNKESVIEGATLSIAYTFCDEKVPYRTRVSVAHNRCSITLKHFKQLLPRRGNFRYFFKTACDDFESGGVVQEEIVDDSSLLPLWQGKIHAQVMSLRD